MAEIRLNKLIREYNIGLDDLVAALQKNGVEVEANPNSKISDEYLPIIDKEFGKDLAMKQAAEKVDIKITEILDRGAKKPKEEEEEDVRELTIKSNTFGGKEEPKPAPKAETVSAGG